MLFNSCKGRASGALYNQAGAVNDSISPVGQDPTVSALGIPECNLLASWGDHLGAAQAQVGAFQLVVLPVVHELLPDPVPVVRHQGLAVCQRVVEAHQQADVALAAEGRDYAAAAVGREHWHQDVRIWPAYQAAKGHQWVSTEVTAITR